MELSMNEKLLLFEKTGHVYVQETNFKQFRRLLSIASVSYEVAWDESLQVYVFMGNWE